jgi:hypothetical protein
VRAATPARTPTARSGGDVSDARSGKTGGVCRHRGQPSDHLPLRPGALESDQAGRVRCRTSRCSGRWRKGGPGLAWICIPRPGVLCEHRVPPSPLNGMAFGGQQMDCIRVGVMFLVLLLVIAGSGEASPAPAGSEGRVVIFQLTDGSLWRAHVGAAGLVDTTRLEKHFSSDRADIALSPDGMALAYTKNLPRGRTVEIVDLRTAVTTPLSNMIDRITYGPAWSADGSRLAINVFDGKKWSIGIVDRATMHVRSLTDSHGREECMAPAWAPSGDWLCCSGLGSMLKLRADNGLADGVLSTDADLPNAISAMPKQCSVSSDGANVLFEGELADREGGWHNGGRPVVYSSPSLLGDPHRAGPSNFAMRRPQFVDDRTYLFLGIPLTPAVRAKIAKRAMPPLNLYLSSLGDDRAFLLRSGVAAFSASYKMPPNKALQSDRAAPGR